MNDNQFPLDRLSEMLQSQRELQLSMPPLNRDPATLEGEERIQFFKDMHIALTDEMHEMLAEMSWKPWASGQYFHTEAVRGELVDVFHFFMNLWLAAGGTANDLYYAYLAKRNKNLKRQEEGYDGVSTKCPRCKRALDDDAVLCRIEDKFCAVVGTYITPLDSPPVPRFEPMHGEFN